MNHYRFNYRICDTLPKLGWSMVVHNESDSIDVYTGSYVETTDNWFVSGVWDGDFQKADFQNAEFFCATGVKLENDKVVVYSPTHERQRICYMQKEDCIIFSNSIPLLMATADERPDKNCDQYEKILCSILYGTKEYIKDIPLSDGKCMKQIFCADVSVDKNMTISISPKAPHREFENYQDYYDSILAICCRIKENGQDNGRMQKKYLLAATASSGYDSSACAAVLYHAGCDSLMTFKGGFYDEDSAVKIAQQIGYKNIIERDYRAFKEKKECVDAEFCVCGDIGVYLQFVAFDDDFEGRIVSIGTSGSYIWDKTGDVNPESKRSGYDFYTANLSFSEHALIQGYIVLPLPLYASTAVRSIQKVSNLPEMEPWTLHTNYDRPICRRILETAGVDGSLFGHKKYGAGFSLSKNFTLKQIRPKMSDEGYKSFVNWLSQKGNNSWTIRRIFKAIQYHCTSIPVYISYIVSKFGIRSSWGKGAITYPNPGLPAKLIVWGLETVSQKYAIAMADKTKA